MRLSIRHTTRYEFSQPLAHGLQRLRLRPKTTHGQDVIEWETDLDGAVRELEYDDQHHNHVELISVEAGVKALSITSTGIVDTSDNAGIIGQHAGHMPLWCFLRQTKLTRPGPRMRAMVQGLGTDRSNSLDLLHELSRLIAEQVAYEKGMTDVGTLAETALEKGHGVCQDHSHIFIGAGRLLDIPMRYIGGYLKMEGQAEQEAGHGWAEAHVEGLGWVGFDVSNQISPDDRYVRVATGCDYSEAAPVTGIAFGEHDSALEVRLTVEQELKGQQQQQQQQTNGR
ncbi:transglutaminase [Novosphingobium marinum]|uniref:Transglutaminase-like putative cysteine protease n=1 Tax=Novosphingobium marinum TaxID=1514948 RepID=A0A7Y9Y1L2_9SPHN|nr:transglutaminase family protein [Novosphingobium marinum]NYH96946.1 transglutaminase-like putative cysteine protease [Novosphingobium marinum]GGC42148.1 transglutaminase [Novosphingobium marinum]